MVRDENGDKNFENTTEAIFLIGEWTYQISSWLRQLRDEYGIQLPMLPYYKSRLLDLANVSKRYIASQKKREDALMEKVREISEDSLCPRCREPRHLPKEG